MSTQEINLLPPDRRRRLRNESIAVSVSDILRSITAGLFAMTLLAGAIGVSLWIYSVATVPTTQEELNTQVTQYQELRDKVARENAVLERLELIGRQRIRWGGILQQLFAATPPGVTIARVSGTTSFAEGKITTAEFMFSGQAITRNALTLYEERLRKIPTVTQVNSPTSNLLERTNPLWQFIVVLTPE